jgi:hypothetical protein
MQRCARQQKLTLTEWVRQTLGEAVRRTPEHGREHKLAVIRAAAEHDFPTADIDEMLEEIDRGLDGFPGVERLG